MLTSWKRSQGMWNQSPLPAILTSKQGLLWNCCFRVPALLVWFLPPVLAHQHQDFSLVILMIRNGMRSRGLYYSQIPWIITAVRQIWETLVNKLKSWGHISALLLAGCTLYQVLHTVLPRSLGVIFTQRTDPGDDGRASLNIKKKIRDRCLTKYRKPFAKGNNIFI